MASFPSLFYRQIGVLLPPLLSAEHSTRLFNRTNILFIHSVHCAFDYLHSLEMMFVF